LEKGDGGMKTWFFVVLMSLIALAMGLSAQMVPLDPPDANQGWLYTYSNRIMRNGQVWQGRGMNVPDTRKCWGTQSATQEWLTVDEVNVIINSATDRHLTCNGSEQAGWGADFIRIAMGAYISDDSNFIRNIAYRQHLVDIVNNLSGKRVGPNTDKPVYVMLSMWNDFSKPSNDVPTTSATGPRPGSAYTMEELWVAISTVFYKYPYVIYGITNEPQYVSDEPIAWQRFNEVVQAIRNNEDAMAQQLGQSTPNRHLIAVQGLNNWARKLDYYITHPITAGGGANVIYETHVYNHQFEATFPFSRLFEIPSQTLPVIIGEFGPDPTGYMSVSDLVPMMDSAEAHQVPYLGWYFQDNSCQPGMLSSEVLGHFNERVCLDLIPAPNWGQILKDRLAQNLPPLPQLILLSPNGSERLRLGSTHEIRWTVSAFSGNLTIELIQDNTTIGIIASTVSAASGRLAWIVGRLENGNWCSGPNFKIRIRSQNTQLTTESPVNF